MTDDQVRTTGSTVLMTGAMVEDFAYFGEVLRRYGETMRLALLGYRNPWPGRGFDFRENAPHNRYPEPPEDDYCDTCGQPLPDCEGAA